MKDNIENNVLYELIGEEWYNIYLEHYVKFGYDKQLTKLCEELSELLNIALKIKGLKENHLTPSIEQLDNFDEEKIDAYIMITQFLLLNTSDIVIKELIKIKKDKAIKRLREYDSINNNI